MKRVISVLFITLTLIGMLSGCRNKTDVPTAKDTSSAPQTGNIPEKEISIVATIFPEYDWVCEILADKADHADVTMLLDNGVDLHSYQPTADDIIKISDCDLFINGSTDQSAPGPAQSGPGPAYRSTVSGAPAPGAPAGSPAPASRHPPAKEFSA